MLVITILALGAAALPSAPPDTAAGTIVLLVEQDQHSPSSARDCAEAALRRLGDALPANALLPTNPTVSRRSYSELDALLLSGIRSAQKLDWGTALNELQEIADALDSPIAPVAGLERLLEARIRLGRTWLDAFEASKHDKTGHSSDAPWRSETIARARAEEQFRAALRAIPTYSVSSDYYPPVVVEIIESIRRSMLAAGQPAAVQFNLPGGTAELVVDGYLRGKGPAAVWPGQHEIRVVDRTAIADLPDDVALPANALGPTWSVAVPQEGLTLSLPAAHARYVITRKGESPDRLADALGISQAIVIPLSSAEGTPCPRPQLITFAPGAVPLSEAKLATLWPDDTEELEATGQVSDTPASGKTPVVLDSDAGSTTQQSPQEDRRWAWASAGVAIASLATGGILGSLALADQAELAGMERYDPDVNDLKNRVDREALATDVFLGLGAAATVAAIVLFIIEGNPPDDQEVTISPLLLRSGAAASARVTW